MEYKNIDELKAKSAACTNISAVKSTFARMRLSALYKALYTNSEFRLKLLAEKIHRLCPAIPSERVGTNLTIGEVASALCENPPQMFKDTTNPLFRTPSDEYKLYLSVIFEIFFLPLYIVKTTD